MPVNGVPLVVHAVRGLHTAGCVRRVVVSAPASAAEDVRAALADAGLDALVVPGDTDHDESVRLALDAALAEEPDARHVLVHDVARALAPPELIRAVAAEVAAGAPVVVPVLPVTDTVKRVDDHGDVSATVDRADLRVTQGPVGFTVDALRGGTRAPATTVPGHPAAMTITTAFDLTVATVLLADRP